MENTRKVAVRRMVPWSGNLGKDRGFAILHQPMLCSVEFPSISSHMRALRKLYHFVWTHPSTRATTFVDKGRKFLLTYTVTRSHTGLKSPLSWSTCSLPLPHHMQTYRLDHMLVHLAMTFPWQQGTLHYKTGMNCSLNLCMVMQLPWVQAEDFLLPFHPV